MDIIKIRTSDKKFIILDLEEIKNKNTLDGADIFKTLLGINENSPFKITNPKDRENLFDKLDISSKDWYLMKSFLNNGFPPYYLEYNNNKDKNESLYNLLIQTIENINRVNITLGGIPSFDNFYSVFYELQHNIIDNYNPVKPEDDYKHLYDWCLDDSEAYNSTSMKTQFQINLDKKFEPVFIFSLNNVTNFKWYRKLKKNDI